MNDQETTQMQPEPPEPPRGPRRLLRSRDDRMIAGVAGGLADYFQVDPVIFRIGFAVSALFGGLGLLAYIALALFVPSAGVDGAVDPPPAQRSRAVGVAAAVGLGIILLSWGIFDFGPFGFHHGGWFFGPALFVLAAAAVVYFLSRNTDAQGFGGVLTRVLLALVAVIGLAMLALVSVWAGATGHGVAIGAAIVAIGALLVVCAFRGGARWLIVPALALALPLAAVAASDIRFGDGVGQRHYRPATFASIPADGYELGIGELKVDLRELPWSDDTVLDLDVDLGLGELAIAVPENVCVSADVDTSAGSLDIAGDRADGIDTEIRPEAPPTARPRLDLSGEVDLGELRVVNLDDVEFNDHGPWRFRHGNDDEMRAAMDAACAPNLATTERSASPEPPGK